MLLGRRSAVVETPPRLRRAAEWHHSACGDFPLFFFLALLPFPFFYCDSPDLPSDAGVEIDRRYSALFRSKKRFGLRARRGATAFHGKVTHRHLGRDQATASRRAAAF